MRFSTDARDGLVLILRFGILAAAVMRASNLCNARSRLLA
jgi:hypothetical protein